MTCVELQQSLAEIEDGSTAAQQAHLKNCPLCSALVDELASIIEAAPALLEAEEPSPRVWDSIEFQLRQEGLIRPQRSTRPAPSLAAAASRWGWARLMVPATALLILVGIYVNQRLQTPHQMAKEQPPAFARDENVAGLNDDELLQEVSNQSPAMKTQYADNLRRVNDYIADAKKNVNANPYDEEARRSLLEAYQQKSMLFELAMDRSLP